MKKFLHFIVLLFIGLLLFGCSNHIYIGASSLKPLIEKNDKRVVLDLAADFKTLKVKQRNAGNTRTRRTFRIGKAQTMLFHHVIDAISKPSSATTDTIDITITPLLINYQVVEPSASADNNYEVKLTYQLIITDLASKQQDKWVIEGKGLFPKGIYTENRGFNQATKKALRDVGTQFLLGYSQRNFFSQSPSK